MKMGKMTNRFSTVVTGACLAVVMLGSPVALAEKTKAIELDGQVLPVKDRAGSKTARRGFDDLQAKIFSAKLEPYFIAAFDKENAEVTPSAVEVGDNKNTTAAAYGGAVALQALRGGGISSSGLAHMGLNLLLGMEGSMLKENQRQELINAGGGKITLARVAKNPSETEVMQSAFADLRWFLNDICGYVFPRDKETYFAKERWVLAQGRCERMGVNFIMETINYRYFPAFKQAPDSGFIVAVSIYDLEKGTNPFNESPELFRERLKSMLPPDWYFMRGDSMANEGKGEFRVWKNKQELVFPLPKA